MSKLVYDDEDTIARHPDYPELKIARHPYSPYAGEVLKDYMENEVLGGTGENQIPVQRSSMGEEIQEVLDRVHKDFRPHIKGTIKVRELEESPIPTQYSLLDTYNFPYSKSMKNIVFNSPNISIQHGTEDPEGSLKGLIATNMIHSFLQDDPSGREALNNLIQSHKVLHNHSLPQLNRSLYPQK